MSVECQVSIDVSYISGSARFWPTESLDSCVDSVWTAVYLFSGSLTAKITRSHRISV
jgi:hypothetical protein